MTDETGDDEQCTGFVKERGMEPISRRGPILYSHEVGNELGTADRFTTIMVHVRPMVPGDTIVR